MCDHLAVPCCAVAVGSQRRVNCRRFSPTLEQASQPAKVFHMPDIHLALRWLSGETNPLCSAVPAQTGERHSCPILAHGSFGRDTVSRCPERGEGVAV